MASLVSQGLQSCLDPRLVDPLVLRHQLTPLDSHTFKCQNSSKENKHQNNSHNENLHFENDNKNSELGDWSFIQALTNTPQSCNKQTNAQNVYVHPLDKHTLSKLSPKSLQMCTENLGCETGSHITEISDEFSNPTYERKVIKHSQCGKKPTFSASYPPPLTSISGFNGVRVRPHREGGRLVIQTVNFSSSTYTSFQAHRTNGRLRLSLLKERNYMYSDNLEEEYVDKLEEGEESEADNDNDNNNDDYESDGYDNGIDEELARPSRCKENNGNEKGMSIWGPYCVAIS